MDKKSIREIAISSATYSIGSILGPLLIFGTLGWVLDKHVFDTYPYILLVSILIAFIVTNVFLFKRIKKINSLVENIKAENKEENN